MDIDKLIQALQERGVISEIIDKRPGVPKLPAQLYVQLIVASLATRKDISACISTALETYVMRNADKHLNEIKYQAAAADKELEQYLADAIASRLQNK
ncbi:hypothetical protein [Nodularia sp. LEGE 04288]|uniref:hypothetical protein n=1 Tax=Nodularia sp. LEGE 04288 TaxID=1828639 RepID=UPI001D12DA7C|nr:hypothetical protein [Nodularia sp. LEGE 04288]